MVKALFLAVLGLGFAFALTSVFNDRARQLNKKKAAADAQFRGTRVSVGLGDRGFDGGIAKVLSESESHYFAAGAQAPYTLTRVALMPDGRSYLFMSAESSAPYVKYLGVHAASAGTKRLQAVADGDV